MYGGSNSEKQAKLNNSSMITDIGQLNESVQTIERVKTSFNVTNDEN